MSFLLRKTNLIRPLWVAPLFVALFTPLESAAQLEYEFHWGRLPVAEFTLALPSVESQVVRVDGSTVGIVGALFNYEGAMQSDYSDPEITVFELGGLDGDFQEGRVINFYPNRPAEITSFLDDELGQPSGELVDSMGVTVDPLKIVFDLFGYLEGFAESDLSNLVCEGEYSVFDGKRHYLLKLAGGAEEQLKGDRRWAFSGLAMRCDISVTYLLAVDGDENNPWHENNSDQRSLWIALVEGELVPVRMAISGPIGYVVGRLKVN